MNNVKGNILLQPWLHTEKLSTYNQEEKKYLCFRLYCFIPAHGEDEDEKLFRQYVLMVPDDNSNLVNQLKKLKKDDVYATPFSNLKYKPNFRKGLVGFGENGLLVKDTSKVEKIKREPALPQITFKVISQKKVKKKEQAPENYTHVLKIEPLDLGIEDFPQITHIIFSFAKPRESSKGEEKELYETELYNGKLLSESAGIKSWNHWTNISEIVEDDNHALEFQLTSEFDQIKEVKTTESTQGTNPNQPQNSKQNNQVADKQEPKVWKTFLVIGVISIAILSLIGLIYYWKKKNEKRK